MRPSPREIISSEVNSQMRGHGHAFPGETLGGSYSLSRFYLVRSISRYIYIYILLPKQAKIHLWGEDVEVLP